ncbi:MAG: hypothetical protein QOJ70_3619 [Acidobacteriota bacterium]|jgi:hypothetical protein|nr:hypothetical protein [Acidobacteriota bacterium]
MSRNYSRAAAEGTRKRRRRNSILLSAAAVIVIVVLLALEQVALLYLIATLGVAALLFVVAFADLHGTPQTAAAATGPAPADDSAAIADRVARPTPAAGSFTTNAPRRAKRRQRR